MENNVIRGTGLSVFIVLAAVLSILGVLGYIFTWNLLLSTMGTTLTYCLFFTALVRWYALYLMWFMFRIGYILYAALSLFAIGLTFVLQNGISTSYILSVLPILLFIFLLKDKWKLMRWFPEYIKHEKS